MRNKRQQEFIADVRNKKKEWIKVVAVAGAVILLMAFALIMVALKKLIS